MVQDINSVSVQPYSQPYALLYMYDYVWIDDVEKYKEIICK